MMVPLLRQPPVYMVLAVVLVSLAPLGLQLFGAASLEPQHGEPLPLVAQAALGPLELAPRPSNCAEAPVVEEREQVIAMAIEEAPTVDAVDDVEVVIIEEADEPSAETRGRRSRAGATRRKPTVATALQQIKTACDLKNRSKARAAYRDLPRGEPRKKARKQCRQAGILLL